MKMLEMIKGILGVKGVIIALRNMYFILFIVAIIFIGSSCSESDDLPPIITLSGSDTVTSVLNEIYIDAGATANDDTDGDISSKIYIENMVNENLVGWYNVTYKAVDQAGNEATPVVRAVFVYNEGWPYIGNYNLSEKQIWPIQQECQYLVYVHFDSTVNYGMTFNDINCQFGQDLYFNIEDTLAVAPFQIIEDSLASMSIQGSGLINDSTIFIEYKKTTTEETSLWQADFVKQQ